MDDVKEVDSIQDMGGEGLDKGLEVSYNVRRDMFSGEP